MAQPKTDDQIWQEFLEANPWAVDATESQIEMLKGTLLYQRFVMGMRLDELEKAIIDAMNPILSRIWKFFNGPSS